MLFNSYEFILAFLPITVLVFFMIGARAGHERALSFLVIASLFFYGWWNPVYLILILFSMVFNFYMGELVARHSASANSPYGKRLLFFGVAVNLGLLGYFKYANFFVNNINWILPNDIQLEPIILPLAISFFTFQQIAYLVDAWQGVIKEYKFSHYALFVTFFPQLIAGPIVHHGEMLPQFMRRETFHPKIENLVIGITIFSIGLFKKAVLADGIAEYASPVFAAAAQGQSLTFFEAWGGVLAYTMQLYFDFSGYSDMAIGAARLFGIRLPLNFYSPYKATSIIEFWRRWHMTLSRFLRDYLYIALGGNRKGPVRRHMNLMLTMLLGGLWHGAGWTFIVWGGLHGIFLIINHGWRWLGQQLGWSRGGGRPWGKALSWVVTFGAVVVGWVFFRAENLPAAIEMLQAMAGFHGIAIPNGLAVRLGPLQEVLWSAGVEFYLGGGSEFVLTFLWIGASLMVVLTMPNTQEVMSNHIPALYDHRAKEGEAVRPGLRFFYRLRWQLTARWAFLTAGISACGLMALSQVSEFLYFQF